MPTTAADILRELAPLVHHRARADRTIAAIDAMDGTLRRCAYELARSTLRECGYELGERNRVAQCSKWSQDFREMVVSAAEVLAARDKGGIIVQTIVASMSGGAK